MKKIINLSKEDKKFVFETTAYHLKIHPAIVEKDFWICFLLNYLFNESKYRDSFTFKGGTSLSKIFDVISRMSESCQGI